MHRDPGFKTIVQIAIVCRDIDATAKRWAALLGVDAPKSITTDPGLMRNMVYRGQPSDAQAKLAFFNTGTCILELIQPIGQGSSWQEHLDQHGESVHHIAFKVQDLDGTIKTCEELGMPIIHSGRFATRDGTYAYLDSQQKLGATVELLNWDKDKT